MEYLPALVFQSLHAEYGTKAKITFSWMCFLICTCFSDHSCAVTTRRGIEAKQVKCGCWTCIFIWRTVSIPAVSTSPTRDTQQGITVVCFFDFLLIAGGRDSTNNVEAMSRPTDTLVTPWIQPPYWEYPEFRLVERPCTPCTRMFSP
jgi:hypothetical protein